MVSTHVRTHRRPPHPCTHHSQNLTPFHDSTHIFSAFTPKHVFLTGSLFQPLTLHVYTYNPWNTYILGWRICFSHQLCSLLGSLSCLWFFHSPCGTAAKSQQDSKFSSAFDPHSQSSRAVSFPTQNLLILLPHFEFWNNDFTVCFFNYACSLWTFQTIWQRRKKKNTTKATN